MARLRVKPSVRFGEFTPALMRILSAVYAVAIRWVSPDEIVITAANDSAHMSGSRHYTNEAIDLRLKTFLGEDAKDAFIAALRKELGPAFTLLHEDPGGEQEHLHIQPKKGTVYTVADYMRDERARWAA